MIKIYVDKRKLKYYLLKLIRMLIPKDAPVGLTAIGIKSSYLDKIYKNHFSSTRFKSSIYTPVEKPYYLP